MDRRRTSSEAAFLCVHCIKLIIVTDLTARQIRSQGWAEPHVGQIQQGIVYSSNLALLALILAQFDLLKADFGCLNGGHLSGGGVVSALTTFESPA